MTPRTFIDPAADTPQKRIVREIAVREAALLRPDLPETARRLLTAELIELKRKLRIATGLRA